jgi:hypothetical protein
MFVQANTLRKTVYHKATQVPRVGSNTIYIAVNPTQRPQHQHHPKSSSSALTPKMSLSASASAVKSSTPAAAESPTSASSSSSSSEQVAILVRPHKGGKPVLLNVPRKIALKVKNGTTLSFSASSDQKYVVISNKIHPPVGQAEKSPSAVMQSVRIPAPGQPSQLQQQQQVRRPIFPTKSSSHVLAGMLPASVSLEPVSAPSGSAPSGSAPTANRRRPAVSVSINRTSEPAAKVPKIATSGGNVLSTGEM